MKPYRLALFPAMFVLSLAAGCNRDPVPAPLAEGDPPAPATTSEAAPVAPDPSGTDVFSRVAPGKGTAVAVLADQSFSGAHVMDRDGSVTGFGVRIGTYYGNADGSLELTLCANAACREAEASLVGAKDNDYLVFSLPEALPVSSGTTLDYTLTRRSTDTANRVAVWVYPKREDQPGVVDPSGKAVAAVARLLIRMQ